MKQQATALQMGMMETTEMLPQAPQPQETSDSLESFFTAISKSKSRRFLLMHNYLFLRRDTQASLTQSTVSIKIFF